MKKLLIILMIVLFAVPVYATTYWVDNTTTSCTTPCDTDYDSSTETCGSGSDIVCTSGAWVTYTYNLAGGDIVNYRAGTYSEYLEIRGSRSTGDDEGSVGNPLIFQAYNSEAVTIQNNGVSDYTVIIRGTDYITLKDLILYEAGPASYSYVSTVNDATYIVFDTVEWSGSTEAASDGCLFITQTSNHIRLIDPSIHDCIGNGVYNQGDFIFISGPSCTIYDNQYSAIVGSDISIAKTDIELSYCTIYNNGYQGFNHHNATRVYVHDNTIYSNVGTGVQIENASSSWLVQNNTIYDNGTTDHYDEGCVWIDDSEKVVAEYNTCYGDQVKGLHVGANGGGGISADLEYFIVRYNEVYSQDDSTQVYKSASNAFSFFRLSSLTYDIKNIYYYNNTAWAVGYSGSPACENGSAPLFCGALAFTSDGTGDFSNINFKNNLISATIVEHEVDLSGTDMTVFTDMDYNLYYRSGNELFEYEGTDYNFTDWKTNCSCDANSVANSDPLFTDTSTFDFTLQASSPAIDAGDWLTYVNETVDTSGTSLTVDDAGYFFDGYGLGDAWSVMTNVPGDTIKLSNGQSSVITNVDYTTNTLTLATSISWTDNMGVALNTWYGTKPDIGAKEYSDTSDTVEPKNPTSLTVE